MAIYSMGHREHPVIRIGKIESSVMVCNFAIFIIQALLISAVITDSFWIVLMLTCALFVFIEAIMVFFKELFRFLRFYITITFTISFPALILYNILLAYIKYKDNNKIPVEAMGNLLVFVAVLLIGLYVFLVYKEKNIIKITSYSAIFNMSLIILSISNFTSQGIYSSIYYIISYIPVMFMLITACYSISDTYKNNGVDNISSVFINLPFSGAGYFVGLIAIMGFPPFSLFFGRLEILKSAGTAMLQLSDTTAGNYIRIGLMTITIIVSTYYVLSKVMPILFGARQNELIGIKDNKYSVFILIFLGILTLLLIVLIPEFIKELIDNARGYIAYGIF